MDSLGEDVDNMVKVWWRGGKRKVERQVQSFATIVMTMEVRLRGCMSSARLR